MRLLYNLGIHIYHFSIRLSALFFNKKAKLWVKGRRHYFESLKSAVERNGLNTKDVKTALFHCASLGEFEQGRPIIENFHEKYPNYKIVLTFFSPSGYEVRKAYSTADYVTYLPIDTPKNAKKFVTLINPDVAFFVKYEFWYNLLECLQKREIPVYLISGIFRPEQEFFKWYGELPRKILKNFKCIFVQNALSKELLEFIGIKNTIVSGDTRFDRVNEIAKQEFQNNLIETFCKDHKVLIAGSTWKEDDEILINWMEKSKSNMRLIIAPHEIPEEKILRLLLSFKKKTSRYTRFSEKEALNSDVLILDTIGQLSYVYRYADIVYIGGGFGEGIHNILEPAAYGVPIIFGPKTKKFQEAMDLEQRQGAFIVHSDQNFIDKVDTLMKDEQKYNESAATCLNYVKARTGATKIIMDKIAQDL